MQPIIDVSNLGKKYKLGTFGIKSLREEISAFWDKHNRNEKASAEQNRTHDVSSNAEVWALRNVTFSIGRGDVVGVVGLNGAGKSTLLKLLSRITEPTEGEIIVRGKLASLLEVGTGFHPELTGRENVYLNGAILGMQRHEIDEKFERIVAFAEVGRFIDTPVKRYSSGMYVRLAFSVAVHLEPEIMIVDEVLAVGDFAFQAKCIERMRELTNSGKTILLVSHNLYTMQTLCRTGLLLKNGRLAMDGPMHRVIAEFRRMSDEMPVERTKRKPTDSVHDVSVEVVYLNGVARRSIETDRRIVLDVGCRICIRKRCILHFGCSLKTSDGIYVSGLSTFVECMPRLYEAGVHFVGITFNGLDLCSGSYKIAFAIMNHDGIATHFADDALGELYVARPFRFDGLFNLDHKWQRHGSAKESDEKQCRAQVRSDFE